MRFPVNESRENGLPPGASIGPLYAGFCTRLIFVAATIFPSASFADEVSKWADTLYDHRVRGVPLPLLSQRIRDADLKFAYAVQRGFVSRIQDEAADAIVGFKVGLISRSTQERFGINQPLCGVLLKSMARTRNAVVDAEQFHRLMIETEIAFVVGKVIRKPLKSKRALRRRLSYAVAAVELPDLAFTDMGNLAGVDIAAANVSASGFLIGSKTIATGYGGLAAFRINLVKDEVRVSEGYGSDAMGDPLTAALWLVNSAIAQGYSIEPGHFLLTGALGKMVPASRGKYAGQFGDLGEIRFSIR